jgi:hypothetical protein
MNNNAKFVIALFLYMVMLAIIINQTKDIKMPKGCIAMRHAGIICTKPYEKTTNQNPL